MWDALLHGWTPPSVVTEDEYHAQRTAPPSALRGFVGFGGSFGGKWFGGYARATTAKGAPRNFADEAARRLVSMRARLGARDASVTLAGYADWDSQVGPNTVVYCDPPYEGTTAYGAAGAFDSAAFWAMMACWSDRGAVVLVSEYTAPGGWVAVWEKAHRQNLQGGALRPETTERLFVRETGRPDCGPSHHRAPATPGLGEPACSA
jgi:DNA adenine methylase